MYKCNFLQPFIKGGRFKELCEFLQDQENQLWDGHPYIYPNLRIFLEKWCDFIIIEGLHLKITETDDGKTRKEIHAYYNELVKQKRVREALVDKELIVKRNEWTFALKIRTVEEAFREIGIDTDNWALSSKKKKDDSLKDNLNDRAHRFIPISEDPKEAYVQFLARFGILRILHDGVYKDFVEAISERKIELYVMPDEMEIMAMVERYYNGYTPDRENRR